MNKKNYKKDKIASNLSGKLRDNCGETIVESARKKLANNRGETIVEALVSLIIAVISIALLVTSITAASKINEKSKARTTEQLSFEYVDSTATAVTGGTGGSGSTTGTPTKSTSTATITFEGTSTLSAISESVTVYTTENGYIYYRKN